MHIHFGACNVFSSVGGARLNFLHQPQLRMTLIVRIVKMPWPKKKTGATPHHAQLELPDNGRSFKICLLLCYLIPRVFGQKGNIGYP